MIECLSKKTCNNVPAIAFLFLNNYTVILELYANNYVKMDLYWNYGKNDSIRYINLNNNLVDIEFQFKFINDLVCKIAKLDYKITNEDLPLGNLSKEVTDICINTLVADEFLIKVFWGDGYLINERGIKCIKLIKNL